MINTNNSTQFTNDPIFYNVNDVKNMLKLGTTKTYQLFRSEGFPAMKIGRDYVIEKNNFEKWVNSYTGKQYLL